MADNKDDQGVGVAQPKTKVKPSTRRVPKQLPPYNVVLLDDDDHSYAYVVDMLGVIFTYDTQKAFTMAKEVDENGRVIVLTTHKELAELKRDQILGYGADPTMSRSKGSMGAIIEPAEE